MLKMKVTKKFFNKIGERPIFQKIALTYGGMCSISLILISLFVSASTSFFLSASNSRELKEVSLVVQNYIKNESNITSDTLSKINTNPVIEINVIKYIPETSTFKIISSPPNSVCFEELFEQQHLNTGFNKVELNGEKIKLYQKSFSHNDMFYTVQTFKLNTQEQKQLKFICIIFMFANLIGVFVSFVIGLYISKRMLKPIKDIRNAAQRISIEDLSQRIEIETLKGNDDLKDLAITFNDMIDRLEKSFKKQSQFVSDASHELRTPISIIQGYANLIDRWGKSDPDILQEAIDSIKSETEHMSKLVKRLLFLAKSDQNKSIQKEIVNLNDIANEISKEIDIMQISQNFILNLAQEQINVIGDYSLIKQMLWVFVENSIKYTETNKNISLSISKDENYAYISVSDEGKGIPKEDIPYIFDRFYRVDKSRNKDIPGTGLGLSIASWIAEQHNAKINVSSELNKGTTMAVELLLYKI